MRITGHNLPQSVEPIEPKIYSRFLLTECKTKSNMVSAMPKTITIRPSIQDRKIIDRLADKLGIKTSQVIKIALRRMAEHENLRLRTTN